MRRRAFLTLLGGAAATSQSCPLAARAQQPALPLVGFVGSTSPDGYVGAQVAAVRQGLSEAGFVEGQNVAVEFRWAEGQYDRLPAFAAEFVDRQAAVILAASLPSAVAAKAATSTVPIVFVMGADPVKLGVVASLNRPGGNATGISQYYGALGAKRLELLRELVPSAALIAIISNPKNPNAEDHLNDIQAAAQTIGLQTRVARASDESQIDAAFAALLREGARALLLADDPFFNVRRDQLIALPAHRRMPAIYYAREFALAGGLISYGSSTVDNYRQAGVYVGRILKGARPADLPVAQPTKFELVINLKTGKALGLQVPDRLLALADEVIE